MRKAENEIIVNESVVKRFLAKIGPSSSNGCQIWMAAKNAAGYGRFFLGENMIFAHRASYIISNGEIPSGMVVMHLCNNPSCVNPAHLRCGTQLENIQQRDIENRGKWASGENHYLRKNPSLSQKGENHGNSKLKERDIWKIRSMHKKNISPTQIAKILDVSRRTVSRVLNGKSWSHI